MASIRKKGDFQWHVQVRRKRISATKTFTHKADAEAWAREIESEIDRGVYVSRKEASETTFRKVCERYSDEVTYRLKGGASDRSRIITLVENLGERVVSEITSSVLSNYRDKRLKTHTEQSVIHELGLINRILKACVMDWEIAIPGGIPIVRKPSSPPGRSRRVDQSEIEAILRASGSPSLATVLRLAMETAMRRGELAKITWDMVDVDRRVIHLTDTKNGEDRLVPLSTAAVASLKALHEVRKAEESKGGEQGGRDGLDGKDKDNRVFRISADGITRAFARASKRARDAYETECKDRRVEPSKTFLIDLRLHDVRHEATTRIADKVDNLIELAAITGHKDLQMLKRYYHPKAEDLAKKLG